MVLCSLSTRLNLLLSFWKSNVIETIRFYFTHLAQWFLAVFSYFNTFSFLEVSLIASLNLLNTLTILTLKFVSERLVGTWVDFSTSLLSFMLWGLSVKSNYMQPPLSATFDLCWGFARQNCTACHLSRHQLQHCPTYTYSSASFWHHFQDPIFG